MLVHTKVWGRAHIPFLGRVIYSATFIDDATHKVYVFIEAKG